jgi:hypothetical protein
MTKVKLVVMDDREGYFRASLKLGKREIARFVVHPGDNPQVFIDFPKDVAASYMRPIPDNGTYEGCILLDAGNLKRTCENAYEHVHLMMEQIAPMPTTQKCVAYHSGDDD